MKENGFGSVDMNRLSNSIDQLATTFEFKNKPAAEDIYTDEFLPSASDRMIN